MQLCRFANQVALVVRRVGPVAVLERLTVRDNASGTTEEVETAALFVLIGARPHTEWLLTHDRARLRADRHRSRLPRWRLPRWRLPRWRLPRPPMPFETSVPGVFAVTQSGRGLGR